MITIQHSGNFNNTTNFLRKVNDIDVSRILNVYGQLGVTALQMATPVESGETSMSWSYEISIKNGRSSILWSNSHTEGGAPIAILLQYGHGTKNGGYVEGRDYINPALLPIFDDLLNEVWREVTRL